MHPQAGRNQSFANEVDESFDLPADLLNQFDHPNQVEDQFQSDFQSDEGAIDFLDLEPEQTLFPEDASGQAAGSADEATWSVDELNMDESNVYEPSAHEPDDFFAEPFVSEGSAISEGSVVPEEFEEAQATDSFATSGDPLGLDAPEDDAIADRPLELDPNSFAEEDTAIADTNGWDTDGWDTAANLPNLTDGVKSNGMSEAAMVAAGLVGAGAAGAGAMRAEESDRDPDGLVGETIGNGRDYAPARAIETTKSSPWLYTFVLLSVSGLIAGLLGYSLWSEVVSAVFCACAFGCSGCA